MPFTVLLVANDQSDTDAYAKCFSKKEYTILAAHSGRQALKQVQAHHPDAIVVDTTSPRLNCKNLCRKLKNTGTPIILITPPNAKLDGVLSFAEIVTKPTVFKRLAARVKSAIEERPPRVITVGKFTLDLEKRRLTRGNKTFSLTPKEFLLLKTLMEQANQVVTRKTLMRQVWDTDYMGDTRTLDVHIRWLREKVEDDPSAPCYLLTERGKGYKFIVK
ncbi:MAG: response regulator transcription factor [Anaerolineae bacterium]|nr:response regulator transcription factor [Anaerolineae bacterium]